MFGDLVQGQWAVMAQDTGGARLVTQNLLISAASAEIAHKPTWSSVQDLAVLIDLFCLYDRVVVLGREINSALSLDSSISDLVRRSGFLAIQSPAHSDTEAVTDAAKRHLLTYLAEEDLGDFDDLVRFALRPDRAVYGLCHVPDVGKDLLQGDEWLRTTPRRGDLVNQLKREEGVSRSTTFLVRSFLYVAYGDVMGLSFVPDSTRSGLIARLVAAERGFRAQLLNKITSASDLVAPLTLPQLRRVSPLAAVVFERAKERKQIADTLEALRSELAPMRSRIQRAEQAWAFGKGDEVADAAKEWRLVIEELSRSYGDEPHLVSVEQILAFGRDVSELADGPLKSKAWVGFLLGLPFDVIRRLLLRRPAIELHRLRRHRPGSGRLTQSIHRLFGTPSL